MSELVQHSGELDRFARLGMWLAALESGQDDQNAKGAANALRLYFIEDLGLKAYNVASLTVIRGRLYVAAELMRAMAARHGYRVARTHLDERSCTAQLSHNGEVLGETTFTIEQARRAGLIKSGGGWEKYPDRMLWARASSWVLRDFAPEVVLGLLSMEEAEEVTGVLVREVDDHGGGPVEDAAPEEPTEHADEHGDEPPPLASDGQRRMIFALLREHGFDTDERLDRLAFISQAVGREVPSMMQLTRQEATRLIEFLRAADIRLPEPAAEEVSGITDANSGHSAEDPGEVSGITDANSGHPPPSAADLIDARARLDATVTERLNSGQLSVQDLWRSVGLLRKVGVVELVEALKTEKRSRMTWPLLRDSLHDDEVADLLAMVQLAEAMPPPDEEIRY